MATKSTTTGFNPDFELEDLGNIPGEELLQKASKVSEELMAGEIPSDVQEQIEIMSAERGIAGGIGSGQAQRNLTARDLGQASLDLSTKGVTLANEIGNTSIKFEALKEQRYEFNRRLEQSLAETELKEATLSLQAHELIAQNDRFAMGLANELIVRNSLNEIKGVQGNIDTLLGTESDEAFFEAQNKELLNLIDRYTTTV